MFTLHSIKLKPIYSCLFFFYFSFFSRPHGAHGRHNNNFRLYDLASTTIISTYSKCSESISSKRHSVGMKFVFFYCKHLLSLLSFSNSIFADIILCLNEIVSWSSKRKDDRIKVLPYKTGTVSCNQIETIIEGWPFTIRNNKLVFLLSFLLFIPPPYATQYYCCISFYVEFHRLMKIECGSVEKKNKLGVNEMNILIFLFLLRGSFYR